MPFMSLPLRSLCLFQGRINSASWRKDGIWLQGCTPVLPCVRRVPLPSFLPLLFSVFSSLGAMVINVINVKIVINVNVTCNKMYFLYHYIRICVRVFLNYDWMSFCFHGHGEHQKLIVGRNCFMRMTLRDKCIIVFRDCFMTIT